MNAEEVQIINKDKEQEEKNELSFLLETSYPLIKWFREQAPGTYKHSQALESMVESVSAELGLDVTFMRVAALYHDIGKANNPKLFTENQLEDEDFHKDIEPWVSAMLLTRHVADGVNILINDKNFPRALIEVISHHHGTSIMKYFAGKAEKGVDLEAFRYKCTRPTCVESAVLIICDSVEASARSHFQSGNFDPKHVIDTTIQNLIDDGQLDEVVMKLGNLKKIKSAIAKDLEGTYQKRVAYPADENKEQK